MSYTYLQGPGAESLADNFSDIEPFVRSRLSLTAERSCCSGSGMESCPGSRSGTTCERSTGDLGVESSMSFAADSHVKTSAQPERAQESTVNDPDSGAKWPESLAKYDPDLRSWKTRQCLLLGGLEEFSETFPRWGMTHAGELLGLDTPDIPMPAKESGFWHPTPTANDAKNSTLPPAAINWDSLPGWLLRCGIKSGQELNPEFSEHVQGWPIGWTASKALEMDKYRLWLRSHGGSYQELEVVA